jgi:hypothetical protein
MPELAGVHRQQDVGERVRALGRQPFDERAGVVRDETDGNARLRRIAVEHGLDELLVARGIDDELVGITMTAADRKHRDGRYNEAEIPWKSHASSRSTVNANESHSHASTPRR